MDYIKDFFAKFNDGLVPKKPSEDSFYVDPVILEREISEYLNRQTPSERIKELFIIDPITKQYPILTNEWMRRTSSVCIVTFFMGGLLYSHHKAHQFKQENQLTVYVDKRMANRQYYDRVLLSILKGGLTSAAKYGSFTGLILGLPLTMSAYYNKSSPFYYVISGATCGSLYRLHHGLASTLVGTVFGAIIGGILAVSAYPLEKLLSMTYEDVKYFEAMQKIVEKK